MNVRTNELYDLEKHTKTETEKLFKENGQDMQIVPEHLNYAARSVLRNQRRVEVSKNSGGKLSEWAKSVRKKLNEKI